jgi:type I restriction enzyme S subunit
MSGRYQAYPEYKDSGVEWFGLVPTAWNSSRLKFESAINMGQSPNSDDCNQDGIGLPFLQGNAEFGIISPSPKQFCGVSRKVSQKGDLLFSVRAPVGALNFSDQKYGIGRGLCAISNSESLAPKFLWWLIPIVKSELDSVSTGSTFEAVSAEQVEDVVLYKPSIMEQQKIANFLDHETAKIDTLIEKQQQLIKLLKEKRQAVISHAVTKGLNPNALMRDSGVEWLGEVPEHWVKKIKLSTVAESNRGSFVNGPFGSDLLANELRDEGVPVVYIRDIKRIGYKRKSTVCVTPEKAEQLDVCRVVAGDVIISKVGDPPGDACIYPEGEPNAIITQDVIRIRVDHDVTNPEYLVMLLNSDFGQMVMNDISVEGTRKRVSLGDFKATKFVIPPLNNQDDIVEYVHEKCQKMDALIGRSEDAVGFIKERRTSLISAAVTGKIDVRNWVAPEPSITNNKEVAA